jgi:hypothetical protein
MSTSSDPVISDILKLYDMYDEHKVSNKVQQTSGFETDTTKMESLCSNSQECNLHHLQPLKLTDNAKDCCIECF